MPSISIVKTCTKIRELSLTWISTENMTVIYATDVFIFFIISSASALENTRYKFKAFFSHKFGAFDMYLSCKVLANCLNNEKNEIKIA